MVMRKKLGMCFVVIMGMSTVMHGMDDEKTPPKAITSLELPPVSSLSLQDQKPMTLTTVDGSIVVPGDVVQVSSVLKKIRDEKDAAQMTELLSHKKKVEVETVLDHQRLLNADGINLIFSGGDVLKYDLTDIARRLQLTALEKKYQDACAMVLPTKDGSIVLPRALVDASPVLRELQGKNDEWEKSTLIKGEEMTVVQMVINDLSTPIEDLRVKLDQRVEKYRSEWVMVDCFNLAYALQLTHLIDSYKIARGLGEDSDDSGENE